METDCTECFKIVCKKCAWEPTNEQVLEIQNGLLTACPVCNWQPQIQSV